MHRSAERLVLEGYRHWIGAAARGVDTPLDALYRLYAADLAPRSVRPAVAALCDFVATLGLCTRCPLRTFEAGSTHICRDETLILGLIAAIQNGDDRVADLCLRTLSCANRCEPVALAAGNLALILKGLDRTLAPIPLPVIARIVRGEVPPARDPGAPPPGTTVH